MLILSSARVPVRRSNVTPMQRFKLRLAPLILIAASAAAWWSVAALARWALS